jgi:hypothetical protein
MTSRPGPEARRGLLPAAVLLFALAGLAVVRAWLPEDWVGETWDPGAAQFLAFYLTLLGVGLLQGSENARRFVVVASAPLLLLAAAVVLAGTGRERLFGLALGALAAGLGGLLFGRDPSAARTGAFVAVAAAGAALVFPLEIAVAREPRDEARRTLARWTAAEREWSRPDVGVRLSAPAGWVVLRPGSPYVEADPAVAVALLHERTEAVVALRVEPEPRAGTLDEYLEGLAERWAGGESDLQVEGAVGTTLGEVPARRIGLSWSRKDGRFSGSLLAWQDARRTLALTARYEADAAEPALEAIDELRRTVSVTLPLTTRIAATAAAAAEAMPQLSRRAIEILVARQPDAGLPALFRESLAAASLGVERLDPRQGQDVGEINRALYGGMPAAEAAWMEGYVGRVRAAQPTTPEEDARAMRSMAAAVNRLPETSRERLRAFLEMAVTAVVRA